MDQFEIEDRIRRASVNTDVISKAIDEIISMPKYYLDPDPYKIGALYKRSAACTHAIKYILRAGNKPGNTYQQDINNAINALKRDLELYEEFNTHKI